MFEKLLSILPYNPSVAHQLRFYAKRMHEEAAIRRTGLIFIVLTFFIQFFAVLNPPQPTVAASNNDLINGGISSAGDAANQCRNNTQHYKDIMDYYGITCYNISQGDVTTITSTATRGDGEHYQSMGRIPQGFPSETPVRIPGVGSTLYWRHLSAWDGGGSSQYKALRVKSGYTGTTWYIIFGCGNLVSIGPPTPYTPPAPTPKPPAPTPKPTPTPTPTPPPAPKCPYNNSLLASDAACKACEYNGSLWASSPECKPCDSSLSSQDTIACVQVSKAASNVTTGLGDANNSTANPGDVINYKLFAKNNGKATVKQYKFQENLSDVLDYADVTDLHGGTITSDGLASWPAVDIPAGQTATVQVTVKVKNPIPSTPVSSTDPSHFDLKMVNVYGNTVVINVPSPPVKTVETATTSLPNTGPGTSLFLTAAVVIVAGYFYSRARLLARESEIAIKQASHA